MKDTLRQIGKFFLLCLIILGGFGTFGWLIYSKAWAILVGFITICVFAYKPIKDFVLKFINNG